MRRIGNANIRRNRLNSRDAFAPDCVHSHLAPYFGANAPGILSAPESWSNKFVTMAEPLAITMLRKKRDKIRDVIAAYEAKLREAQADLAHVNATLRLFAASGDPVDFPPYVDLNRVFRRGEALRSSFQLDLCKRPHPRMQSSDSCAGP